jgi:hypothetical protein
VKSRTRSVVGVRDFRSSPPSQFASLMMRFLVVVSACVVAVSATTGCLAPSPAKNFDVKAFYGTWYEIARVQTAGDVRLTWPRYLLDAR